MRDEIDLDEISNHIKELQKEDKKESIIKKMDAQVGSKSELQEWEEVPEEDIFEVLKPSEENITRMDINLSTRKCDMCKKTIKLDENLSGLVVHDTHFLCEDCCKESSKEDLDVWMNAKMAKPGDLKPVALWLMKEKNKTRLF